MIDTLYYYTSSITFKLAFPTPDSCHCLIVVRLAVAKIITEDFQPAKIMYPVLMEHHTDNNNKHNACCHKP